MSDKPPVGDIPRFAHTGTVKSANIVEPSSAKKDSGWTSGEEPPSSFLNWLAALAYAWIQWISDGAFTRASLTDRTPVVSFTDQDGNARTYVDPHGYFFGPVIEENFVFNGVDAGAAVSDVVVSDNGSKLSVTTEADTLSTFTPPTGTAHREHILEVTDVFPLGADGVALHTGDGPSTHAVFGDTDNVVAVAEYRLKLNQVGASGVHVYHGFHEDPDNLGTTFGTGSAFNFCLFRKEDTDTNWFVGNGDGAVGSGFTDTGTPPVVDTYQTFRVEFHGANTPVGVDATDNVARYFIDGALELEVVGDGPDASVPLGFAIFAIGDGSGPTGDFYATVQDGIKISWNLVLTPDVPA